MAQFKKDVVRERIVSSAEQLFADNGYVDTTMASIARSAGISKSNIYVYYGSKLEILWAIAGPWLHSLFDKLEDEIRELPDSNARTRRLFEFIWCDMPADRNGFANNLMQALSTASESEGYSKELRADCEARFAGLLAKSLPAVPLDVHQLAHIALMAFDGFSIGRHLSSSDDDARSAAKTFTDLLLRKAN